MLLSKFEKENGPDLLLRNVAIPEPEAAELSVFISTGVADEPEFEAEVETEPEAAPWAEAEEWVGLEESEAS